MSDRITTIIPFRRRRRRRAPAPTRLAWALGAVILVLLAGVGLGLARAQTVEEEGDLERLASRGSLAAEHSRLAIATLAQAVVATPASTPEPTRYVPSVRGNRVAVLERIEVEALAADVFGPALAVYVSRIAWCESRHRPGAQNAGWDRFYGWFDYRGLLQISTAWTALAVTLTGSDDLYDGYVNLVTARAIQRQQGWGAWPLCSR